MFQRIRMLLEMIRFSHTLFALPFALLSAALAWKEKNEFSWIELGGIVACMVFARSAAMAFNRLADRGIDAANPRTAQRHLPAGQLSTVNVPFLAGSITHVGARRRLDRDCGHEEFGDSARVRFSGSVLGGGVR